MGQHVQSLMESRAEDTLWWRFQFVVFVMKLFRLTIANTAHIVYENNKNTTYIPRMKKCKDDKKET